MRMRRWKEDRSGHGRIDTYMIYRLDRDMKYSFNHEIVNFYFKNFLEDVGKIPYRECLGNGGR